MSVNEDNDELIITNKTFNKLQENATKSGFRDGISDGRDSNFQTSFDAGYEQGFKNGFNLGLYKGALSSQSLQKVIRGNCIICTDKTIEEKPISQIIQLQTDSTNQILQELSKNQYRTEIYLPKKL